MSPDINLKGYFLAFQNSAKDDIIKYSDLNILAKIKVESLYNYLIDYIDDIKNKYNIDVTEHKLEWVDKKYNVSETLYNKTLKKVNSDEHPKTGKVALIQLLKYCNALRVVNDNELMINNATIRSSIKFSVYSKYVTNYYNQVQKVTLNGLGYKFGYGIGTYCINLWRLQKDKVKYDRIDFAETNKRKKELIAQGKTLYDDNEAKYYKEKGIPYNGVDYRVYKTNTSYYEFTFINSEIFKTNKLEYKRIEYVATKYRGMSYKDMAKVLCKNEEDVYDLQVDIKYKLNIILHKDPNKYLNFIRNDNQLKYDSRTYSSQV